MKHIPLTHGKVALVDDEDYARISRYKWYASETMLETFYAMRAVHFPGLSAMQANGSVKYRRLLITMARQIMGLCSDDPRVVDHKNHDTLDNRRYNLRICTVRQNIWNRRKPRNSHNRYKGSYRQANGEWFAMIKKRHIGTFNSEIEERDKTKIRV